MLGLAEITQRKPILRNWVEPAIEQTVGEMAHSRDRGVCRPGARPDRRELQRLLKRLAPGRRVGGLADVERDLIRTHRRKAGARAGVRGQRMGRPSKLPDAQKAEARRRRAEGATLKEMARSYDVGLATISRLSR